MGISFLEISKMLIKICAFAKMRCSCFGTFVHFYGHMECLYTCLHVGMRVGVCLCTCVLVHVETQE